VSIIVPCHSYNVHYLLVNQVGQVRTLHFGTFTSLEGSTFNVKHWQLKYFNINVSSVSIVLIEWISISWARDLHIQDVFSNIYLHLSIIYFTPQALRHNID
jgi:hypothetical protein